jgi:hypothetical protein
VHTSCGDVGALGKQIYGMKWFPSISPGLSGSATRSTHAVAGAKSPRETISRLWQGNFLVTAYLTYDNHMFGTMLKNLWMFANLCGGRMECRNVSVATTMWSQVKRVYGELREARSWRDIVWRSMVVDGCKIERFEDSLRLRLAHRGES